MKDVSGFRLDRLVIEWLLILLFLSALGAGLVGVSQGWRIDNILYDSALRLWNRMPSSEIVVIAIDDASLTDMGRWPWSRGTHARLLEELGRAKPAAIGIEVLFSSPDPDDHGGDQALAEAIRQCMGRVVLPAVIQHGSQPVDEVIFPLSLFRSAGAQVGFAHVDPDVDGIVRGIHLREGVHSADTPHFVQRLLEVYLGGKAMDPAGDPNIKRIRNYHASHWMGIPFVGGAGSVPMVSARDVMARKYPVTHFKDKIVIIGVTAAGIGTQLVTPRSHDGLGMSSLEFHAQAVDALLNGVFIQRVPTTFSIVAVILLAVLMMVLIRHQSPDTAVLTTLVMLGVVLSVSVWLLRGAGWWFPPLGAITVVALAYPLWNWRKLSAVQRFMDRDLLALATEVDPLGAVVPKRLTQSLRPRDSLAQRLASIQEVIGRLRNARRYLIQGIEKLPIGVIVIDAKGLIVMSNSRAASHLGYSREDLLGLSLDIAFDNLRRTDGIPLRPWSVPLSATVQAPGGGVYELSADRMEDATGAFVADLVTFVDATARHEEERLRRDMLSFLTHDMRSPQSGILTLIEHYREGRSTIKLGMLFDRISAYAKRTLHLAEDFMQLVRAEQLDATQFREIDLNGVIDEATDEVWAHANGKGISVNVPDVEERAIVDGDVHLLRRVLVNLLRNAIQWSRPGSEVHVCLRVVGGYSEVSVSDSGPGLPQAAIRTLTLESPDDSRLPPEGATTQGLGLLFVRTTVAKHRGRILVQTDAGKGTRVTLFLPAKLVDAGGG